MRGAAMTARLLSDKSSPLNQDDGHDLRRALRAARLGLDAADPAGGPAGCGLCSSAGWRGSARTAPARGSTLDRHHGGE